MPPPLLTIVATDIRPGPITLELVNNDLAISRSFFFLDSENQAILMLPEQTWGATVPTHAIPPAIRTALGALDAWTEAQIRESLPPNQP